MKKFMFILVALIGFGISANAENNDLLANNDECKCSIYNSEVTISGTTVTITVTVKAPNGTRVSVVSTTDTLQQLLGGAKYCSTDSRGFGRVEFTCSVNDNTYNQCRATSSFECTCQ